MDSIDLKQQRAWVEIDLSALAHNVRAIKRLLAADTEIMAVVKADAYGHGAIEIAQTLLAEGIERLAVATVTEGVELREQGQITAPILILGAINSESQIHECARWQLQPTLCDVEQATTISTALTKLPLDSSPLTVHLKIDTGMSRLGTDWQRALTFFEWVVKLPHIQIGSLYSHLATADEQDETTLKQQFDRFEQAIESITRAGHQIPLLHLANSAGILVQPGLHYQLVRPGLIVYGLYPAPHFRSKIDLQPVLSVKARITQLKNITTGTGVSYGYQFTADRDLRLAVVGIGYADGVPRRLSGNMQVSIRGRLVRQIGAITMDQLMLDVSQFTDLQVGEIVTILGRDGSAQITADDWANRLGTISWEILCGFKHRLPRVAIHPRPVSNEAT